MVSIRAFIYKKMERKIFRSEREGEAEREREGKHREREGKREGGERERELHLLIQSIRKR